MTRPQVRVRGGMLPVVAVAAGLVLGQSTVWAAKDGNKASQGSSGHPKNDFVIPMNYELGMHCTGFEFAYCCVLPPYNSILAQVIKTEGAGLKQPLLLEGDPNIGKDAILKRETVVRDPELDADGNFKKYRIRYWHEAQDRSGDPNGKPQLDTLISAVELNSLFMWNTIYDRTAKNADGTLKTTDDYNNAKNVPIGNIAETGFFEPDDNYASGWLNHLYIYAGCDTDKDPDCVPHPNLEGRGADGIDLHKIYLGIDVPIPVDCGPSLQPMGPYTSVIDTDTGLPMKNEDGTLIYQENNCGGVANGNVLTFSTDDGTVVYTKANVLDDLPIMLTSPRIWEALGLPLTPFEDSIGFFDDPGLVDEDSIRPYVKMMAEVEDFHTGLPVLDSKGNPVRAFGTAPIDIPNCERCHSELAATSFNSAQQFGGRNSDVAALVEQEMSFWKAYYDINDNIDPNTGETFDSTWYARLKGAAISILAIHDNEHGTQFTQYYGTTGAVNCVPDGDDPCASLTEPVAGSAGTLIPANDLRASMPQNTRLGHESVICQKCHADNVIAVVRGASCTNDSLSCGEGDLIPPVTEALHNNHTNISEGGVVSFTDSLGRDGGCQGCHPAHRSDGDMDGYPITLQGDNFYQDSDNRVASGGCFVGRDVHSNPLKDVDGAETPSHLNAVGQWLADNVFHNQSGLGVTAPDGSDPNTRGIWCTNCHSQLSQEIWKAENVYDLINNEGLCVNADGQNNGQTCKTNDDCGGGESCALYNVRNESLEVIAQELAGGNLAQVLSWLDPKGKICENTDDPNLIGRNCNNDGDCGDGSCVDKSYLSDTDDTHRVWDPDQEDAAVAIIETRDGAPYATLDGEGDVNVRILDFCTTDDCVLAAQAVLDDEDNGGTAVAVPFGAATDGRDHWLSPGEPHCADCHAAPYVEPSGGNIGQVDVFGRSEFRPPFNYPRKASLMRYSRGHQDITCQGCHESIHGLYPVTPTIDTTTYAQAAQWNSDDSHGPLKCGACHTTNAVGVNGAANIAYTDPVTGDTIDDVRHDFDAAVSWMHTYTENADPRESICLRCHTEKDADPNDDQPWDKLSASSKQWAEHASMQRVSRKSMDKAEINTWGHVLGTTDGSDGICIACHKDNTQKSGDSIASCSIRWKKHLVEGRVSESVWEHVSMDYAGSTCGW